jgi:hypothetical protein
MFLDSLEAVCMFYERSDPESRDQIVSTECAKCTACREPVLGRLYQPSTAWLVYCIVKYLPSTYSISETTDPKLRDLLNYLNLLFGKQMISEDESKEADLGFEYSAKIRRGGFLLMDRFCIPPETEEIEYMHMVTVGDLVVWRRR